MRKNISFLLIIMGVTAFFVSPIQGQGQSAPSPQGTSVSESFGIQRFQEKREGSPFSLKDLEGNQVTLSRYKGKPVLLFFWASWCAACKEDIVLLKKIFEGEKSQFEILTIVIDGEKEGRVKRLVREHKVTLPVLLDVKEKTARIYGVRMVPTAFLINREGLMEGMIVGQRDWCGQTALPAIKELLGLY